MSEVGFELVLKKFYYKEGEKRPEGYYSVKDFLTYYSDYPDDLRLEIESKWIEWKSPEEKEKKNNKKIIKLMKKQERIKNKIKKLTANKY